METTEQSLFSEKEMFTKERPKKLPDSIEQEFYVRMAKEVLNNRWVSYLPDPEEIAEDLKEIMSYDSGYEAAKRLEDYGKCSYEIDMDFLQFLGDLKYKKDKELEKLVKEWVKIHEIKPKFQKGIELIVNIDLGHIYKLGAKIFITGIKEETANYLLWDSIDHNGGYVVAYERVESSCSVIEEP